MYYCDHCKLTITNEQAVCPLCQGTIKKLRESEETFPFIPTIYQKNHMFFRILIMISVVVSVLSVLLDLVIPGKIWWSLFVLAGILCMWISLAIAIFKRRNILQNLLWQVTALSLLAIGWDLCTGWHQWSVNYVFPIICSLCMLLMAIISRVLSLYAEDYMISMLIALIFGVVQIILLLTGVTSVWFPSLLCISLSICTFAGVILFEGKNMYAELKRRFHL